MRLLTYNIHKGIGGRDRLYRLPRIIEVIENENPDLLCLQEVDRGVPRSRLHDQPRLLAEHFFSTGCTFLLNVRSLAENGCRHCTHPIPRYRTFPAYLPVGSLDKVFSNSGIRVSNLRVVRSKVAKAASDHLPLVVDFHCD